MGEGPSAFEQVTREQVKNLDHEVGSVKDALRDLWKSLDSIRKEIHEEVLHRLPPWVTAVISVQTALIGGMAIWILDHLGGK